MDCFPVYDLLLWRTGCYIYWTFDPFNFIFIIFVLRRIVSLAICGGFDAYDTWEQTHSWEAVSKKILEAIVDAGVGIGFGVLVAMAIIGAGFTAPIWLTILAGAAISTGLSYLADNYIVNPLIEKT